jgi:tryptophan 2,3-dioxygenase
MKKSIYYGEYIQLNKLLDAQKPLSQIHEENLFIIVHQSFELWFKQILFDLDSIIAIFSQKKIKEKDLQLIITRLNRIILIQKLLFPKFDILETMSPMEFLEFRDLLMPASGFQSIQFREVEIKLGLRKDLRFRVGGESILSRFKEGDQKYLLKLETQTSLLEQLEKWLERTPFLSVEKFDFWKSYKKIVFEMLKSDEDYIKKNPTISEHQKVTELQNIKNIRATFDLLINEKETKGKLSKKAQISALFILLYREEPILHLPYRILSCLMDVEENFRAFRLRHALLAQRMLGTKIGTGGSSGHEYLKKTVDTSNIFNDLLDLSTFLIPKSKLPKLPKELKTKMGFAYDL